MKIRWRCPGVTRKYCAAIKSRIVNLRRYADLPRGNSRATLFRGEYKRRHKNDEIFSRRCPPDIIRLRNERELKPTARPLAPLVNRAHACFSPFVRFPRARTSWMSALRVSLRSRADITIRVATHRRRQRSQLMIV